jgi:hypothetical protein
MMAGVMHVDAMRKQRNLSPCATASPLSYGTAKPAVQSHHRLRRASKDDGEQGQDSGANQRCNGAAKSAPSGMTAKPDGQAVRRAKILMK